ncbi:hypothetical protein [Nocardioides pakistanensis]
MANANKRKGDKAELEAVRVLVDLAPDLARTDSMRMLGAGRKEDVGDLRVFDDVAIQVRNYAVSSIGTAIRSAAVDASVQAARGRNPFALGMVPIPNARKDSVRWLACVETWPTYTRIHRPGLETVEFALVSKAIKWLRDDVGPYGYRVYPREQRVAHLTGSGAPVLVAPIEAWMAAYREGRTGLIYPAAG